MTACKKDNTNYVRLTIEQAKEVLDEKEYQYEEIIVENESERNGVKYFDFYVVLSGEYKDDFALILSLLNDLRKSSYSLTAFEKTKYVFMEYVKCEDKAYQVNSTDEYVLEEKGKHVSIYNSIAEKCGVNLTNKEKARIYKDLDYYLTVMNNGKYTYTENEAFNRVASKYQVTEEFLRNKIWIPEIYAEYLKYYN